MTNKVQWEAAFVAFCSGAPLEEISQAFSIPMEKLQRHVFDERWIGLRSKMLPVATSGPLAEVPAKIEARLRWIEDNRTKNLAVFEALRENLLRILAKLRSGELQLERQWHNRGGVTRAMVDPSIVDLVNLATYARTIADGTYRALGDFAGQEKALQDFPAGQVTVPAITIILPGAVAAPRDARGIEDAKKAPGQIIDLTDLGQKEPAKLPAPKQNEQKA